MTEKKTIEAVDAADIDAQRVAALAAYLDEERDEVSPTRYDDMALEHGNAEYLVLTDDEADQKAFDYIMDSLWAFRAEFLEDWTGADAEMIQGYCEKKCESANDTIRRMLHGQEKEFVEAAVSADGRGHFLSGYDGNEGEQTIPLSDGTSRMFFIYRTN